MKLKNIGERNKIYNCYRGTPLSVKRFRSNFQSVIQIKEDEFIFDNIPEETVKNFTNYFPHNNIDYISKRMIIKQKNIFHFIEKKNKRIKATFFFKNIVNRILRSINKLKENKNKNDGRASLSLKNEVVRKKTENFISKGNLRNSSTFVNKKLLRTKKKPKNRLSY